MGTRSPGSGNGAQGLIRVAPARHEEEDTAAQGGELREQFRLSLEAAAQTPENDQAWDRLEQIGRLLHRVDEVAAVYRSVLQHPLPPDVALRVGQRAIEFHDEWIENKAAVVDILQRILEIEPCTRWAFDRMSLHLTSAGRWEDLLALYDLALGQTTDGPTTMALLEEAAQLAKDCAGQTERAIRYLERVFAARPEDPQAASALERLLRQQHRHRELIDFWTARLPVLGDREALQTRHQIAACWLDNLHDPTGALDTVRPLLDDEASAPAACSLLEKILGSSAATRDVRAGALELLSARYDATDRWIDVVRALERALGFVRREERAELHSEIVQRLVEHDRHAEALEHLAALVALDQETWNDAMIDRVLAGEFAEVVAGCKPRIDRQQGQALLHRAAAISASELADQERAIVLYRRLLQESPDDMLAVGRLVVLYQESGRLADLLALRQHELALAVDLGQRLVLRLEIAQLLRATADHDGSVAVLRENLQEQPDHEPSIGALISALEQQGSHAELARLLRDQAKEVESRQRNQLAASLWQKAAQIAELQLRDTMDAVACYRRVVDLAPNVEALDALARISGDRGQHAAAVEWLEKRLSLTEPGKRTDTIARLARAHAGAGHPDQALGCLQQGIDEDPGSFELRRLIAEVHRRAQNWEALVRVLLDGAARVQDPAVRFELLVEAADAYQWGLGEPDKAVPALEQAVAIRPADQTVRTALADALRAAGRLEEAKQLAEALIEEYGRRRPPERAVLHLLLAQVLDAQGNTAEAIRQLETASGMDMANERVQHMLGNVYREAGQLDRAERAFHALLLILRRQRGRVPRAGRGSIGIAETLFELHRVAAELGAADRASENLASAFDTAAQDEGEARRLQGIFRKAGNFDLLLRALGQRLEVAAPGAARAAILTEMIDVLDTSLGKPDEAFDAALRAIGEDPGNARMRDLAGELAVRTGALARYADELGKLADRALGEGDGAAGCELLLALGQLMERSPGNLESAASLYARAEDTGERLLDVWRAMAHVAGARGDRTTQLRALRKIVDTGLEELELQERVDALFALADLELGSAENVSSGLSTLEHALSLDPSFARAARSVRKAIDVAPEDEQVIAAFERVARASGDHVLLLDALERRVLFGGTTQAIAREAVELASLLAQESRTDRLLERAVEHAKAEMGDAATALWALRTLASRAKRSGDQRAAVRWMTEAAEVAEPDEARLLWLDVAATAADKLDDLQLAVATYDRLLELDPSDPTVWKPMLETVRRTGDKARLERMLAAAADAVFDAQERAHLRLEQARLVLASPDRAEEASALLRAILDDDPDHVEAGEMLGSLFEREGRYEDLATLLRRRLDAAHEHQDAQAGVASALRLGALPLEDQRQTALDAYRAVLEWVPDHPDLLRAMLPLLDPTDEAADRASVLEKLLSQQSGEEVLPWALELVGIRQQLVDHLGVERALEHAWRAQPDNLDVQGAMRQLAVALERDAEERPDDAISLLVKAAFIHKDRLEDPVAAAGVVSRARAIRPQDLDLLELQVQCQLDSGQIEPALDVLTDAVERQPIDTADRVALRRLRARVYTACNRHDDAVRDLEEAVAMGDGRSSADLHQALIKAREAAAESGDTEAERAATLRLSAVLQGMGETERARNVIARWVEREPDDVEALRMLIAQDNAAGRWDDVIDACARLVAIETGPAQVDAVLKLADACEAAGRGIDAKENLEHVFRAEPADTRLRDRLRRLYESIDARRELSNLLLVEANQCTDDARRFELLRDAGRLRMSSHDQAAAAIGPLSEALAIRADDFEATILLADAYIAAGIVEEAVQLLRAAIDRQGGRRSRELAALQHRMARAAAAGDRTNELSWLAAAFETHPQNGDVASELAELATELGHYDVALKALRSIATMKTAAPISRPLAFLKQAQIAHLQGDDRKAVFLAKKALSEDADFAAAQDFLRELGSS